MKFLFDYFPLVCFFIAFKLWGIFVATAVAMAASILQVGAYWVKYRRFEKFHLIVLVLMLTLGSLTLIFHNPIFVKWKPTIVYWAFSIVLFSSHIIGSRPIMHRLFQDKIQLPDKIWAHLNASWAIFFLVLGIINVIVLYTVDTVTWVYFKVFVTLGLTLLLILAQATYIAIRLRSLEKGDIKKQ